MNIFTTFGGDQNESPATAGEAKLGQMNFAFIDMGQGDCTIISTPDNTVYIVDCGSSGGLPEDAFEQAKQLVRAWAKASGVYMIMTHPDKDHYNKFISLLTEEPAVAVYGIYFSYAKSDTSPLGNYKETALMRNIALFGTPRLVEVTLNETDSYKKVWESDDNYTAVEKSDFDDTGLVLDADATTDNKWSLSIIAGNVETNSMVSIDETNVRSLVTLARFKTDKLVLTGDSTTETLDYLETKQEGNVKNAAIFQAPHHGSDTAIPSTTFRDLVKPKSLLVSVGLINSGYCLPKSTVLDRWLEGTSIRAFDRVIDYWTENTLHLSYSDIQNVLAVTWKDYEVLNNDSRTFYWLANPADAEKSGTGYYGFTNKGYLLYRKKIKRDVYLTGVLGSLLDDGFKNSNLLINI